GAITAAILSSELLVDQIEALVGSLDYMALLRRKTSCLIFNGDPSDDLNKPAWMLANLQLIGQLGEYGTEPFRDWLASALAKGGIAEFGDISRRDADRQLKVVVSDLTHGEMRVFPDDLAHYPTAGPPERFSVAEAVRLSMSIPLFFEPGRLGNSVIVD